MRVLLGQDRALEKVELPHLGSARLRYRATSGSLRVTCLPNFSTVVQVYGFGLGGLE